MCTQIRYYVIFSLLFFVAGCSQTPQELKGLHPVTITVTNNNKPLGGVVVSLINKQPQPLRGCSGLTDSKGVAVITTKIRDLSGNGAASGEYKVILTKNIDFPEDLQWKPEEFSLPAKEQEYLATKRNAFWEKNNIIPQKFQSPETSPLDLNISDQPAELKVNVAE
ncbi:MAG: hypothetical protein LBJ00_16420 [Planctomycetaceae bacterium]|jgi:hypothetical protein|nr:hypothetical protein [Planctomycetaceae bacterium]